MPLLYFQDACDQLGVKISLLCIVSQVQELKCIFKIGMVLFRYGRGDIFIYNHDLFLRLFNHYLFLLDMWHLLLQLVATLHSIKPISKSLVLNAVILIGLICPEIKSAANFSSVALLALFDLSMHVFPLAHNFNLLVCFTAGWHSTISEGSCLNKRRILVRGWTVHSFTTQNVY